MDVNNIVNKKTRVKNSYTQQFTAELIFSNESYGKTLTDRHTDLELFTWHNMKLWLRDKKAPEKNLQGSKPKLKTKAQARTRASSVTKKPDEKRVSTEPNIVTDGVKVSPKTTKSSFLNKCCIIGLLLGVTFICVSTIGLVFGLHLAKSSEKPSDVNIETVSNITEKNTPSPKKVIKNGKEYFVMSKKQAC